MQAIPIQHCQLTTRCTFKLNLYLPALLMLNATLEDPFRCRRCSSHVFLESGQFAGQLMSGIHPSDCDFHAALGLPKAGMRVCIYILK